MFIANNSYFPFTVDVSRNFVSHSVFFFITLWKGICVNGIFCWLWQLFSRKINRYESILSAFSPCFISSMLHCTLVEISRVVITSVIRKLWSVL